MSRPRTTGVAADQRFERWTVVDPERRMPQTKQQRIKGLLGRWAAWCRCDCGIEKLVPVSNLVNGLSRSCGCLKREVTAKRSYKHGIGNDDYRYRLWWAMRQRCYNPATTGYANYGGRGISVHGPWHDFATFAADLDCLLGPRPPGHSLDRIDNDGNYEPGNIRWATYVEQANNRRSRWRNR